MMHATTNHLVIHMRDYIIFSEARFIRGSGLINVDDKMLNCVQVTVVVVDLDGSQGEPESPIAPLDHQLWSLLCQGDHFIDWYVMLATGARVVTCIKSRAALLFAAWAWYVDVGA